MRAPTPAAFECFERDGCSVFHGDALEVLRAAVPRASVDLVFADPPYNLGKTFGATKEAWASEEDYVLWCREWIDLCVGALKPNGTLYLMASTQAMPFLDLHLRAQMTVLSRIVWAYDSSGVQAKRRFGSLYEPILHCVKNRRDYTFNAEPILVEAKTGASRRLIDYRKPTPARYNTRKVPGNVWTFPRVRYRMDEYEEHPAQKPEALLERIILASTNEGDLILDPFAGTFTTSAVAKRLRRRSIGIEREREYVAVGLRRMSLRKELDGRRLEPPKKTFGRTEREDEL
jgi:site-specific DNA-methyltransferase (adenine-specific)